MSHISKALRLRASGKAAPSSEPGASSLHQYDREERATALREAQPTIKDRSGAPAAHLAPVAPFAPATAAAPPAPVAPVAPAAPVAPVAPVAPAVPVARVKPVAAVTEPPVEPEARVARQVDGQARLVTGTSSAVSIEQYRRLAATLHQAQAEQQLKTVMITSALPGEGKTLTAINLALTLSESYERRVLVIDADLRHPSTHKALGVANTRGLSEALRDGSALSFVEVSDGMAVLTAGSPGPTPLAGLASTRMADILEECATRFDWVLIDTPPIGVLPDAQVLARLVGAVLLVIGAGTTPVDAVERAVAELGGADAIFGIVLNRVDQLRIPSADYYGHYKAPSPK